VQAQTKKRPPALGDAKGLGYFVGFFGLLASGLCAVTITGRKRFAGASDLPVSDGPPKNPLWGYEVVCLAGVPQSQR
jgi:hypothetical protein